MVSGDQRITAERKASRVSKKRLNITLSCLLLLVSSASAASAQRQETRIQFLSLSPARIKVEGERTSGSRTWSFRNTYAGIMGLGERIENLTLLDASGNNIPAKKLAPGEYEATSEAVRFSYEVRVDAPSKATDAAYSSWLTNERGFLMLGDLLPRSGDSRERATTSLAVRFIMPRQWIIATNEMRASEGLYEINNLARAVFYVGKDLRLSHARVGEMDLSIVTAGEWAFTDEDLSKAVTGILKEHTEIMSGVPRPSAMLMLSPFPRPMGAERWSAETRGATVMLLAGKSPSKIAALAQLGTPLAHELFHLWIPNGLALDGEYDWFYEGFTLYQALRAGVRLQSRSFDDYLNALGRAFDLYMSEGNRDKLSLIEASARRWTGSSALIYQKGMLVAFLYDLTLRQRSDGKRSLDDVYRELFRRFSGSGARSDGNRALIATLSNTGDMQEFVRRYIENASAIDLPAAIAPFGLQAERVAGFRTRIVVTSSLSRAQRDLLRKLGYNEKSERTRRRG